jgi:hypothetical protein
MSKMCGKLETYSSIVNIWQQRALADAIMKT